MRSLLKYLSTRPKYCVPLRTALALRLPLSIKSVEQGRRAVPTVIVDAGVGQAVEPKYWPTVCASVIEFRFVGVSVVSIPVPTVLGKFVFAKATNAGSAKVCPPAIV